MAEFYNSGWGRPLNSLSHCSCGLVRWSGDPIACLGCFIVPNKVFKQHRVGTLWHGRYSPACMGEIHWISRHQITSRRHTPFHAWRSFIEPYQVFKQRQAGKLWHGLECTYLDDPLRLSDIIIEIRAEPRWKPQISVQCSNCGQKGYRWAFWFFTAKTNTH